MATFPLTQQNIDFSKRALRTKLPHVKATHLIEAFAASTGFRTYAALRAKLKSREDTHADITTVKPIHFSARLAELGYKDVAGELLVEIIRSPNLPNPAWREIPSKDLPAANDWFRSCQKHGMPYVWVEMRRMRRKYARLNWDCISLDPADEEHLFDSSGTTLVEKMYQRFQYHAIEDPGHAQFDGIAFAGAIDNLLPAVARELADEFLMMLCVPNKEGNSITTHHQCIELESAPQHPRIPHQIRSELS
ncbi:MAG: hypothetical protein KUG61_05025 [Parvibaculaceae bacterium]|nr:hypothetical protein [Parvibaculaceae bacterium]